MRSFIEEPCDCEILYRHSLPCTILPLQDRSNRPTNTSISSSSSLVARWACSTPRTVRPAQLASAIRRRVGTTTSHLGYIPKAEGWYTEQWPRCSSNENAQVQRKRVSLRQLNNGCKRALKSRSVNNTNTSLHCPLNIRILYRRGPSASETPMARQTRRALAAAETAEQDPQSNASGRTRNSGRIHLGSSNRKKRRRFGFQ